jgi:transposase InsO family protein
MGFQGQGTSSDGMCQALGLIDTTSRFVVVIPLPNREATTLIQPCLDRVVYTHGPPVTLHSDAAPEFLDQLVQLAADATDTHTTNTLGHNAQGNAAIEIFWRFWNLESLYANIARRPLPPMAVLHQPHRVCVQLRPAHFTWGDLPV